jgi:hypothetical protein
LLPDDLLLASGASAASLCADIPDEMLAQAVEKYISRPAPAAALPAPLFLDWDPIVFDVDELIRALPQNGSAVSAGDDQPRRSGGD